MAIETDTSTIMKRPFRIIPANHNFMEKCKYCNQEIQYDKIGGFFVHIVWNGTHCEYPYYCSDQIHSAEPSASS